MSTNNLAASKPIVFMLHGFPNTSQIWQRQVPEIAKHAQVVLLTFPTSASNCTIPSIIDVIASKVRETKLKNPGSKIVFVGHDMGACLLNEVASQYPGLVNSQILINGGGIRQIGLRLFKWRQFRKSYYVGIFCMPFITNVVKKFARMVVEILVYRGEASLIAKELKKSELNDFDHIYLYKLLILYFFSGKSQPVTSTETIFVVGEDDPYLLSPSQKELERFFRKCHFFKLNSGHWSPFTNYQIVNQIIKNNLQALGAIS